MIKGSLFAFESCSGKIGFQPMKFHSKIEHTDGEHNYHDKDSALITKLISLTYSVTFHFICL